MTLYKELLELGEYYLAGYAKSPKKSRIWKTVSAIDTHLKYMKMPVHGNNIYYPDGNGELYHTGEACSYSYSYCLTNMKNDAILEDVYEKISPENREAYQTLLQDIFRYRNGQCVDPEYNVGGVSFCHGTINYDRILREGLDSYLIRIKKNYEKNPELYEGLEFMWQSVKNFHRRCIKYLKSLPNPDRKLIKALENVPYKPAETFYEAMVCVNFMFYIDGCDCVGRFDQFMKPYLTDDISDEEALFCLKEFWRNVNDSNAWQVTIGGYDRDNSKGTNRISELVLKSVKGFRRPQVTFQMMNENDKMWDLVFDAWESGGGQPAVFNGPLILEEVAKHMKIKEKDKWKITFGGCTETHIFGSSNVGSTACGLQNLLLFERAMYYHLPKCRTYEEFYGKFLISTKRHILRAVKMTNLDQELKAKYNPLPIRSLFVDDTIDTGVEFQAGGARYNASSFNYAGTSNLVNALYTLKILGFGKKYSNEEIISACKNNFEGYKNLLADIKKLPKFGQDCEEVDLIAQDFFNETTDLIRSQKGWRPNCVYCPTYNLFVTFGDLGRNVGATPDGRLAYTPVGDSIGATRGDDTKGPTALINSVTKIPLKKMVTIPVFNIRIAKSGLKSKEGRKNIKALTETFFAKDGVQMQATVADQAELLDALKNPEAHRNLIVRIGGYSEYFWALPEDLKLEVIKRNQHF